MMAAARVELGISSEEFWGALPRDLAAMFDAARDRRLHRELLVGMLAEGLAQVLAGGKSSPIDRRAFLVSMTAGEREQNCSLPKASRAITDWRAQRAMMEGLLGRKAQKSHGS